MNREVEIRTEIKDNSRKGDSEVESLPQASKGNEGPSGKAASGHLTVRLFVLSFWTLAKETPCKAVDTLAAVLAHTRYAPVR